MRKSLITACAAALVVASAGTASAATPKPWRVTYVSPETGYDDFGLYDVTATGANDAWAVGSIQQGAGGSGVAMRWNGSTWTDVTLPGKNGSYNTVNGSSRNNVWVTGATATSESKAWHWDGSRWTGSSLDGYQVADVSVVGPRNVWAVGNASEGSDVGEARHWNGTAWKTVAMPFVARKTEAVAANDIWAVGENSSQPLAAHWDGTSWKSSGLPTVPIPEGENGFSYFNDLVAISSDNVWAVGRLFWGGGEEVKPAEADHNRPMIMHWDGVKWSLTLGTEGDFALSAGADGNGGIWYASANKTYVHVAPDGTTTTVPVPTPEGRDEAPEIRQITGVPGGTKVLSVGQAVPAPGDQSWDGLIEQYH